MRSLGSWAGAVDHASRGTCRGPLTALIGVMASVAILAAGCTGGHAAVPSAVSPTIAANSTAAGAAPTPTTAPPPSGQLIPQPPLSKLNERTRRRLAPDSRRVDLVAPSFTHPTEITNPLFPISTLRSAVLVGRLDERPWRAETTLLPEPEVVEWNGVPIETLRSQFVAYLDGRIFEVAVDRYAQADDGSVWYFGEDAYTYRDGRVSDTEGTWLAGVNGPPAMIMPGHPRVGDVYRTENIPPLVFEQVTVKKVGVTVQSPSGPVKGAMIGQELHLDEARLEAKTFAPGYGEFFSGGGRTFEATALAIPADALPGPVPAQLDRLWADATGLFDEAASSKWSAAESTLGKITAEWNGVRGGQVPVRLAAEMRASLRALAGSVGRRAIRPAQRAALDVAQADLDLQLRYRDVAGIDLERFGLWIRRLQADAEAGDAASVVGDVAALRWIRERVALPAADGTPIDDQLRSLEGMAEAGELSAASAAAERLRQRVAGLDIVQGQA